MENMIFLKLLSSCVKTTAFNGKTDQVYDMKQRRIPGGFGCWWVVLASQNKSYYLDMK